MCAPAQRGPFSLLFKWILPELASIQLLQTLVCFPAAHWHNGAQQTRSTKETAMCFIGTSQQPMLASGEPGPGGLDGGLSGH